MYTIKKRIEIAGAHKLDLPYESPCQRLHGHNWFIEVELSLEKLDKYGMVADFSWLKKVLNEIVMEEFDHRYLNDVMKPLNPTAENIAKWIHEILTNYIIGDGSESPDDIFPEVSKVTVQESEGNVACYTP